jgi:hypothetical protein
MYYSTTADVSQTIFVAAPTAEFNTATRLSLRTIGARDRVIFRQNHTSLRRHLYHRASDLFIGELDSAGCSLNSGLLSASVPPVLPGVFQHQLTSHIPVLTDSTSLYTLYNRLFALASRQAVLQQQQQQLHHNFGATVDYDASPLTADRAAAVALLPDAARVAANGGTTSGFYSSYKPSKESSPSPSSSSPGGDSDSSYVQRLMQTRFHPYYLVPAAAGSMTGAARRTVTKSALQ